jgi:cytochrome b subunit of formate dehydrogenase
MENEKKIQFNSNVFIRGYSWWTSTQKVFSRAKLRDLFSKFFTQIILVWIFTLHCYIQLAVPLHYRQLLKKKKKKKYRYRPFMMWTISRKNNNTIKTNFDIQSVHFSDMQYGFGE